MQQQLQRYAACHNQARGRQEGFCRRTLWRRLTDSGSGSMRQQRQLQEQKQQQQQQQQQWQHTQQQEQQPHEQLWKRAFWQIHLKRMRRCRMQCVL